MLVRLMKTKLIEFKNKSGNTLRGILVMPCGSISNLGVICLHGFERVSTTEKKFKKLADKLAERKIPSFRFDYTGCGA